MWHAGLLCWQDKCFRMQVHGKYKRSWVSRPHARAALPPPRRPLRAARPAASRADSTAAAATVPATVADASPEGLLPLSKPQRSCKGVLGPLPPFRTASPTRRSINFSTRSSAPTQFVMNTKHTPEAGLTRKIVEAQPPQPYVPGLCPGSSDRLFVGSSMPPSRPQPRQSPEPIVADGSPSTNPRWFTSVMSSTVLSLSTRTPLSCPFPRSMWQKLM
mmetsp:Transcript_24935/g.83162  ORF Transcript_24935/g.83162 Transcript_24935/m.83162 type:complete len:217 (+) Transcript_24935:287-937(+)